MKEQNNPNLFPVTFTLEHVNGGYILTTRSDEEESNKVKLHKEVVSENAIAARIAQLLHFGSMNLDIPIVFRVEAYMDGEPQATPEVSDKLVEAKLAYLRFKSKDYPFSAILVLQDEEAGTLEILGPEAESVANSNNLPLSKTGGVSLLSFLNTPSGRKSLAGYCPQQALVPIPKEGVLNWYKASCKSSIKTENK